MSDPACWGWVGKCEALAWLNEVLSEGLVIMQEGNLLWRVAMPQLGGCLDLCLCWGSGRVVFV